MNQIVLLSLELVEHILGINSDTALWTVLTVFRQEFTAIGRDIVISFLLGRVLPHASNTPQYSRVIAGLTKLSGGYLDLARLIAGRLSLSGLRPSPGSPRPLPVPAVNVLGTHNSESLVPILLEDSSQLEKGPFSSRMIGLLDTLRTCRSYSRVISEKYQNYGTSGQLFSEGLMAATDFLAESMKQSAISMLNEGSSRHSICFLVQQFMPKMKALLYVLQQAQNVPPGCPLLSALSRLMDTGSESVRYVSNVLYDMCSSPIAAILQSWLNCGSIASSLGLLSPFVDGGDVPDFWALWNTRFSFSRDHRMQFLSPITELAVFNAGKSVAFLYKMLDSQPCSLLPHVNISSISPKSDGQLRESANRITEESWHLIWSWLTENVAPLTVFSAIHSFVLLTDAAFSSVVVPRLRPLLMARWTDIDVSSLRLELQTIVSQCWPCASVITEEITQKIDIILPLSHPEAYAFDGFALGITWTGPLAICLDPHARARLYELAHYRWALRSSFTAWEEVGEAARVFRRAWLSRPLFTDVLSGDYDALCSRANSLLPRICSTRYFISTVLSQIDDYGVTELYSAWIEFSLHLSDISSLDDLSFCSSRYLRRVEASCFVRSAAQQAPQIMDMEQAAEQRIQGQGRGPSQIGDPVPPALLIYLRHADDAGTKIAQSLTVLAGAKMELDHLLGARENGERVTLDLGQQTKRLNSEITLLMDLLENESEAMHHLMPDLCTVLPRKLAALLTDQMNSYKSSSQSS